MAWKGAAVGWLLGTLVGICAAVLMTWFFGLTSQRAFLVGLATGGIAGPAGMFTGMFIWASRY